MPPSLTGSGYAQQSSAPTSDHPLSGLESAASRIETCIAVLIETANRLERRLEPVLLPESKGVHGTSSVAMADGGYSPAARQLHAYAEQLQVLNDRLGGVETRLDLAA